MLCVQDKILVMEDLPESFAHALGTAVASGDCQRWLHLVDSFLTGFERIAATRITSADVKPGHFRVTKDDR
jgi:hypothetical protein